MYDILIVSGIIKARQNYKPPEHSNEGHNSNGPCDNPQNSQKDENQCTHAHSFCSDILPLAFIIDCLIRNEKVIIITTIYMDEYKDQDSILTQFICAYVYMFRMKHY